MTVDLINEYGDMCCIIGGGWQARYITELQVNGGMFCHLTVSNSTFGIFYRSDCPNRQRFYIPGAKNVRRQNVLLKITQNIDLLPWHFMCVGNIVLKFTQGLQ